MKLLLLLLLLCPLTIFGQSEFQSSRAIANDAYPSNTERYSHDYIIADESLILNDSTILETIDLELLEYYRKPNERVEIKDKGTGVIVILFSFNELRGQSGTVEPIKEEE